MRLFALRLHIPEVIGRFIAGKYTERFEYYAGARTTKLPGASGIVAVFIEGPELGHSRHH